MIIYSALLTITSTITQCVKRKQKQNYRFLMYCCIINALQSGLHFHIYVTFSPICKRADFCN